MTGTAESQTLVSIRPPHFPQEYHLDILLVKCIVVSLVGERGLAVKLDFVIHYGFVVKYVHDLRRRCEASPAISATVDMMRSDTFQKGRRFCIAK